jgi:prolyl oligopeptidase
MITNHRSILKMRLIASLSKIILILSLIGCQQPPTYPSTPFVNVVDTFHGKTVADPYRWMENMTGDSVKQWVDEQEKFYNSLLDEEHVSFYEDQIHEYWKFSWYEPFRKYNGKYYFRLKRPGDNEDKIYVRDTPTSSDERVIFHPRNELDSTDYFLGVFSPSSDMRYIAIYTNKSGSNWHTIRIKDMKSGKMLDDVIHGCKILNFYRDILWNKQNTGFYYVQFDAPLEGESLRKPMKNPRLRFHKVGTDSSTDPILFQLPNSSDFLYFQDMTFDQTELILRVKPQSKSETSIYSISTNSHRSRLLMSNISSAMIYFGNTRTDYLFRTNENASNYQIRAMNRQTGKQRTLIEESELPIRHAGIIGNHMVLRFTEHGKHVLKSYDMSGKYLHDMQFKRPGYLGMWPNAPNDDYGFLFLVGPHYPGEQYQIFPKTGETIPIANGGSKFNTDNFVFEHQFYTSNDGTRVPLFIAYRNDLRRDGSNPVFLYAYGAYGYSSFPWFAPQILALVENGGIYIHANVRGGGEYGEDWHQNGIKTKKQNGIDDVIAAAEWAINEKWTSPKRIAMNGVSGGGSLAAAAVIQRPDLFGLGIINISMLDFIRYSTVSSGAAKVAEWGDVNRFEEFDAIMKYSPYHTLSHSIELPPMFIQAGEKDETAPPFHSYKFVAQLQATQKNNPNPMMLRIARGAGHSNGTSRREGMRETAEELYFFFKYLK